MAMEAEGEGPFSYENWKRYVAGEPWTGAAEYPLYGDGHVTGEETGQGLDLGPYKMLNSIAGDSQRGRVRPIVYLQVDGPWPEEFTPPRMDRTDAERYHGGLLEDEIAALLSLALGVRFRPGGVARRFWPAAGADGDRGHPYEPDPNRVPVMSARGQSAVLPRALSTAPLADAEPLQTLPDLRAEDAIALIRAARSYQQGLWIAEAEPELGWLFMVSAVETAADHWWAGDLDNLTVLRENKPELFPLLHDAGEDVAQSVAGVFAPTMRATHKFLSFFEEHLPPAPPDRPPEVGRQDWDSRTLRRALSKAYGYRSKALHEGRPIPPPMCQPPFQHHEWAAPSETPLGGAMAIMGGVWRAEDIPMILHTFEYLVRGALLRWWTQLPRGVD